MGKEERIEIFKKLIQSAEKEIKKLRLNQPQQWEKEIDKYLDIILSFREEIEELKKK